MVWMLFVLLRILWKKNLMPNFAKVLEFIPDRQVARPKSIDVLISMRQNVYHPGPVKTIGNMILYDGLLGKVFGGTDDDLAFTQFITSYPLSVKPTLMNSTTITMKASVVEATCVQF